MTHDPDRRRLLAATTAGASLGLLGGGLSTTLLGADRSTLKGPQRGPRPNLASGTTWPAWRIAMAARTWAAIPSRNTLRAIDPARDPALNPYLANNPNDNRGPWGGVMGLAGVVTPWCGACYDSGSDSLWLPLGGGHQDYAGNEAYALCLADEVPEWRMPRPPSGSIPLGLIDLDDGQEASGNYADGRPRAIHSGNKHVYVPGRGAFMAVQGSTFRSGQAGTSRSMLLNSNSGEWTTLSNHPAPGQAPGAACYDSEQDAVWWLGGGQAWMSRFVFASGTWQVFTSGSSSNAWGYYALTHAPEHGLLIAVNNRLPTGFAVWDTGSISMYQPGVSNAPPAHLSKVGGQAGCVWVPSLGAVAMWQNETTLNPGAISLLRAPTNPRSQAWTWDTLLPAVGSPLVPSTAVINGTFGRFGFSPNLDGFFLLNSVDQPVYFFALSDSARVFSDGFEGA